MPEVENRKAQSSRGRKQRGTIPQEYITEPNSRVYTTGRRAQERCQRLSKPRIVTRQGAHIFFGQLARGLEPRGIFRIDPSGSAPVIKLERIRPAE